MVQEQDETLRKHEQLFGKAGRNFVAPARVNLIGEHTDYTGDGDRVSHLGRY
jgi:galactokinase